MISSQWLENRAEDVKRADTIDPALYAKYNVKRGLRNSDGTGVLVGLTTIGNVHGYYVSEGEKVAVPGKLYYRGVDVEDFVHGCEKESRFGFEECAYLLLFGSLPNAKQLNEWKEILGEYCVLPPGFKERGIMRAPGKDLMNALARATLMAYTYDDYADSLDIKTNIRQAIELIARFPTMAAYAYQAKAHYHLGEALIIRRPQSDKSTAENFLRLIREDANYTKLEAETLDMSLVLHAEHGGGNNSSFTTHVISSAFTDMYSSIAASILSLKGPRHGGANLRTMRQIDEMKTNISDWTNKDQVAAYLEKIARKEAGDKTGLIYGLGHAVYTISDPRAELLKVKARQLAEEKGRMDEFVLYESIENMGPEILRKIHPNMKDCCANVDLYSGFVYSMLGIPRDLYTPLFAIGRVVGWCAHRLEELGNNRPIIRPAYKPINMSNVYEELEKRK